MLVNTSVIVLKRNARRHSVEIGPSNKTSRHKCLGCQGHFSTWPVLNSKKIYEILLTKLQVKRNKNIEILVLIGNGTIENSETFKQCSKK